MLTLLVTDNEDYQIKFTLTLVPTYVERTLNGFEKRMALSSYALVKKEREERFKEAT